MNEDPNTCFNLREVLDDVSLRKDYANNEIARQITINDILNNEEQQPFAYQNEGVYDQRTQQTAEGSALGPNADDQYEQMISEDDVSSNGSNIRNQKQFRSFNALKTKSETLQKQKRS